MHAKLTILTVRDFESQNFKLALTTTPSNKSIRIAQVKMSNGPLKLKFGILTFFEPVVFARSPADAASGAQM